MQLVIQAAVAAIENLPEAGNLTMDNESTVNEAGELVLQARQLWALPTSISAYDKFQVLKARLSLRALQFDGADDYVSVAHAAWIQPENFDSPAAGILSKHLNNGVHSSSLRLSEVSGMTDLLEFTVNDSNWMNSNRIVSNQAVPKNEWTHIAAVFNQSGGTMQLYINGVLSGQHTGATMAKSNSPINIGRDFSSRYF